MNRLYRILAVAVTLLFGAVAASAQYGPDKSGVRKGNRAFDKKKWQVADLQYRRALLADSTSFAGNYNLAGALYRQEDYDGAAKSLEKVKGQAEGSAHASDYWYNVGDAALQKKDWQAAVDAFKKSLILAPDDLDAKENYIYAKLMLKNQQDQQNQQNQDQQNQDQQNQDQNQDQQNQDQNQDQQDQNQDQQNQDRNQDQQNQDQQEQPQISQQQAQQILQAIQAREKETQDKVNKEKAAALKARQKDKNW